MSLRNHKISVKGYNGYFLKISIVWVLASYLTMCVSNLAAVAFMILSCLTLSFLNIRFYCDHNDQSHLASKDTITAWCKVRILEESTSENLQIETENISVAIILCLNVGDLFCFSERVDSFNIHNSELKSWCWSSYDYKLHYHFSLLVCSVVCLRCCNKLATQLGMNYEVIRLKYYSASLMLIFSFSDAFTFCWGTSQNSHWSCYEGVWSFEAVLRLSHQNRYIKQSVSVHPSRCTRVLWLGIFLELKM